uniref:Uncharacterized protein n=1 Tax=Romanomermis culicivorax TaxID=13658 RepID=A0A915JMZ5_ROMCU
MENILHQYTQCNRPPVKEVKSTKNNRVEHLWVEQNKRVGYPLKYCLLDMELGPLRNERKRETKHRQNEAKEKRKYKAL